MMVSWGRDEAHRRFLRSQNDCRQDPSFRKEAAERQVGLFFGGLSRQTLKRSSGRGQFDYLRVGWAFLREGQLCGALSCDALHRRSGAS